MKLLLRPSARLLVVTVLAVTAAFTPLAALASTPARIAGHWQVEIRYKSGGNTDDGSEWSLRLREGPKGKLSGNAQPDEIDCIAVVTGSVTGSKFSMVWTVKPHCATESLTFKGSYVKRSLRGTVTDSKLGPGTFKTSHDD